MTKRFKIPEGWLDYIPIGKQVLGTCFLPFKVPLKEELLSRRGYNNNSKEWFTPNTLLEKVPNLKLIIDLTNTDKYYNVENFIKRGIRHKKICCLGRGWLPDKKLMTAFYDEVDDFIRQNGPNGLIGVHCTHGLNRTGYFICKYMVNIMGVLPEDALNRFQRARGHTMNRLPLVNDILNNSRHTTILQSNKGSNCSKHKEHNLYCHNKGYNSNHTDQRNLYKQANESNSIHTDERHLYKQDNGSNNNHLNERKLSSQNKSSNNNHLEEFPYAVKAKSASSSHLDERLYNYNKGNNTQWRRYHTSSGCSVKTNKYENLDGNNRHHRARNKEYSRFNNRNQHGQDSPFNSSEIRRFRVTAKRQS